MRPDEMDRYWVTGPEFETPEPQQTPEPLGEARVVGQRRTRVDAYERVSGSARYPSDTILPGMLHAAILRCPHPHARVRSVDVSAAQAMPGVRAVITGLGPIPASLAPHEKLVRETLFAPLCRYEGEDVAAVAADTPYIARDALRAITVDYEPLPFVSDERDALAANAPPVRPEGNKVAAPSVYERGSLQAGFAAAEVTIEHEFRTECELHTPLEPHGCAATWDGDSLTVFESTQGVFPVQNGLAAALGIPLSKVRVIGHYMGGGFGSKLGLGKYTTIASLLAKVAARPVKLFITREETMLAAGNRPPNNMRVKIGAKKDGTLTAIEFSGTGTGGAYQAGGVGGVDFVVRDLYTCPNVRCELQDLYINAGPARAFRAPGHPQGAWALEQAMDLLAEELAMDPIELRLKNVPVVSQSRGNIPYTTTGFAECLRQGAAAFGWKEARARAEASKTGAVRRGVGVAAGMWQGGGGGPPSTAIVKLFSDGSVNLNMGASDIGTGTKTVMAMVVAEELWVDPDSIQIEHADTGTTQYASASGGSKTVPTESPAVRAAAIEVRRQVLALAAAQLNVDVATLALTEGKVVTTSGPAQELKLTELRELRRTGVVVGVGYRGPNPSGKAINPWGVHFCEVQVDTQSGEVEILRLLAVQDSGRVMNRTTYENQVRGGVVMGIGLGTTERRILDRGRTGLLLTRSWQDYRIPTALDVPPVIEVLPVDLHDKECNHVGCKGIGEPATIPTAPAVANAVHHAVGVRIANSPVTPAKVVAGIADQRKGD